MDQSNGNQRYCPIDAKLHTTIKSDMNLLSPLWTPRRARLRLREIEIISALHALNRKPARCGQKSNISCDAALRSLDNIGTARHGDASSICADYRRGMSTYRRHEKKRHRTVPRLLC